MHKKGPFLSLAGVTTRRLAANLPRLATLALGGGATALCVSARPPSEGRRVAVHSLRRSKNSKKRGRTPFNYTKFKRQVATIFTQHTPVYWGF